MPEYLAPGVYIEETSFRPKTIEGVSTSTTGFVGPTRFGPTEGTPELITSLTQFERIYGGLDPLSYQEPMANYLAHAVRAFFDNGGSRLYIARLYKLIEVNGAKDKGIGTTLIPAPTAVIRAAYSAAERAVISSRKAVNAAISTADEVGDAVMAMLRAALTHISDEVTVAIDFSDVDLRYNDSDAVDAVDAAVDAVISSIEDAIQNIDENERLQATTALEQVKVSIEEAIAVRFAAETTKEDATTLRTLIDKVKAQGMIEGNAAAELADVGAFNTAIETANTRANEASTKSTEANATAELAITSKNAVNLAAINLAQARSDERVKKIEEVVDAAEAAQLKAQDAVGSVKEETDDHAPEAAFNAVAAARIVELAAKKFKVGDIKARFPGEAGNVKVTFMPRLGDNVLQSQPQMDVKQVRDHDLVSIRKHTDIAVLYIAHKDESGNWLFTNADETLTLEDFDPDPDTGHKVQVCSLTLQIELCGKFDRPLVWPDLSIHPERRQDGILNLFGEKITNQIQELETPIVIKAISDDPSDNELLALAEGLIGGENMDAFSVDKPKMKPNEFLLSGGNDGRRPTADEYKGQGSDDEESKSGLVSFEDLEEISIIAAPGLTFDLEAHKDTVAQATQHLITHCEKMAYRVAVIDCGNNQGMSQVREYRAKLDSKHAALYYPWITILDPITQQRLTTPPSGFVAGIYARNDANQGVHKAPANEIPRGAIELETHINKAQQDVLNPIGINCLRYFENRGIRVWGARTLSSDPEWKYLNLRRYFAYLERSIEKGTQWVVFENNGQRLWDNVRRTVEDFLFNEWKSGRLMGATTEEAYFVRCDRTTMTQNDWDNGRLICLVGVAPLRPAEFVIFRIGQKLLENKG